MRILQHYCKVVITIALMTIANPIYAQQEVQKNYQILTKIAELDASKVCENAFNPGMIVDPYNNHNYLMTLRREAHQKHKISPTNTNWLAIFNEKFELLRFNQLDFGDVLGAYDATIFTYKDQSYLTYSCGKPSLNDKRVVGISTLDLTITNNYVLKDQHLLVYAPGKHIPQKNWAPFVCNDKVYFVYSIAPHTVLEWQVGTDKIPNAYINHDDFSAMWNYGQPHGGTPAIYIKEHDCYLTIFQSHTKTTPPRVRWITRWRKYYIGAYIFEAKPPFRILAYTQEPLTYPGLYDEDCDTQCRIIFPRGLVDKGDHFLISAGLDDHRSIILSLDRKALWDSLTYLNTSS